MSFIRKVIDSSIHAFVYVVTIPFKVLMAIFYVPVIQEDGTVKRTHFSITRFLFLLACGVIILRLGTGGISIDRMEFGPNVKPSVSKKEKKKRGGKLRAAKRRTRTTSSKHVVWFSMMGVKHVPLTFYDVVTLVAIAFIYFFRNQLDSGDESGLLEKITAAYLASQGVKMDLRNTAIDTPQLPQTPQTEVITEEEAIDVVPMRGIG